MSVFDIGLCFSRLKLCVCIPTANSKMRKFIHKWGRKTSQFPLQCCQGSHGGGLCRKIDHTYILRSFYLYWLAYTYIMVYVDLTEHNLIIILSTPTLSEWWQSLCSGCCEHTGHFCGEDFLPRGSCVYRVKARACQTEVPFTLEFRLCSITFKLAHAKHIVYPAKKAEDFGQMLEEKPQPFSKDSIFNAFCVVLRGWVFLRLVDSCSFRKLWLFFQQQRKSYCLCKVSCQVSLYFLSKVRLISGLYLDTTTFILAKKPMVL